MATFDDTFGPALVQKVKFELVELVLLFSCNPLDPGRKDQCRAQQERQSLGCQ